METILIAFLFAVIVAYGVISLADPERSMRLDRTGKGGTSETALRNRRIAGGITVVLGVTGAAFYVGLPGILLCVIVAGLARLWLETWG